MNYFELHIGDHLKATAHLDLLEHGVYFRLLTVYYAREAPIPTAEAGRLIGVRTKEEKKALTAVLSEFFRDEDGHLHQSRCDREISRYQDKQRKASASANARWNNPQTQSARNAKAGARAMRTHTECNAPNHQTPNTSIQGAPVEHHQHGDQFGPDGPARAGSVPSATDAAADAMTAAGLTDVSRGNPKLRQLIEADVSVVELAEAATEAVKRGSGFAWALARVEGQRRDAASKGPVPKARTASRDPDSRAAIEADGIHFGLGAWQQIDSQGRTVPWVDYADQVKARRRASQQAGAAVESQGVQA
jgi:uncharacterized protein YdaU (DUF1376 family)